MEVNSFYILLVDVTLFLNENPHAASAVKGLNMLNVYRYQSIAHSYCSLIVNGNVWQFVTWSCEKI